MTHRHRPRPRCGAFERAPSFLLLAWICRPPPAGPAPHPGILSKVKSIFRERSRERGAESQFHHKDGVLASALSSEERLADIVRAERRPSLERGGSRSPTRKLDSRSTEASFHKVHRYNTTGHARRRGDDAAPGLRGLLRAPRIDTVIRSGVSKVSDMIWRKDGDDGDTSSSTSSDESDIDRRGRSRVSPQPSHASSRHHLSESVPAEKHYLDVMPRFVHAAELGKSSSSELGSRPVSGVLPPSSPPSRRSSRFDLLKPPRIDVQDPSRASSVHPDRSQRLGSSDVSETDSRKSSYADGVRQADGRLNPHLPLHEKRRSSGQTLASQQWSIPGRDEIGSLARQPVSKFEVARMRTLVMTRGIKAMEMDRRAKERRLITSETPVWGGRFSPSAGPGGTHSIDFSDDKQRSLAPEPDVNSFSWPDIVELCPDPKTKEQLQSRPIAHTELYMYAGRILGQSIQSAGQEWQASADKFSAETVPALQRRVGSVRQKAVEISEMTHLAADEADEVSRDVITGQRLKIKRAMDIMEKMLRRRRRRFRWVRRAGWLAVEWVLVGFMWYVWFVVMIARIFLGIGKGLISGVRWLLWL